MNFHHCDKLKSYRMREFETKILRRIFIPKIEDAAKE